VLRPPRPGWTDRLAAMDAAQKNQIATAVEALPEEVSELAARWFERLLNEGKSEQLTDDAIAPLAKLVASSEFAAGVLLREWQWFTGMGTNIDGIPDTSELNHLVEQVRHCDDDIEAVRQQLRRFRHRYMLQILWREVTGTATLVETLSGLSDLADHLLDAAAGFAEHMMHERFGVVRGEDDEPVSIVILGMGKLGGRELNFSSDIDLIFLFPAGKDSDGQKSLSAQEYFTRVSRHIIALLDEVTADGFAFRIDTRLRPFGDSGPPVVSFAALESYLLQHGRDWERYAYVKARIVGPQPNPAVANELHNHLVVPFVYRRYLDFGVFESLRSMHGLIAAEVERREMADNIKLGPGGIREIEFIVQSLQLVRGGSRTELQDQGLLQVLPRLAGRQGLPNAAAAVLRNAYDFLRRLENFIQAIRDQQTHDLPTDACDRARLCLAMGYQNWEALREELDRHRNNVTREFDAIAFRDPGDRQDDQLRPRLAKMWARAAEPAEWKHTLMEEGFSEAGDIATQLVAFSNAAGTRQIDSIAQGRLQTFMPDLLLLIKDNPKPSTTLLRVLSLVEKILRRSAYLALLNENGAVLARLVRLCGRSVYIAEQLARYPVLLDELLDPELVTTPVSREELATELNDRLAYDESGDSESQVAVLSQFQRASLFRVAIADFSGSLPIMKVSDSLTFLAEVVLNQALEIAWRDLTEKHGDPEYVLDGERHKAGFGIIAYGKLGGLEMSYGSDLDLVFLHDSRGTEQSTSGDKPLENSMFFTRLVRRLSHFLTTQTGSGMLYEVDTRLRPDGQSGVMVSSIDAFERYQEEHAWTWEHQALLRARPVTGSADIAREFERIRAATLSARVRREELRDDVVAMRGRMRAKLDQSDEQLLDFKQGAGGIADIEFIVQFLVLANAEQHPSVFYYSDNIRQLEALAQVACISEKTSLRLQEIYKSYRLRIHHLALDEKKPLGSQEEFSEERTYVERLWERTFGAVAS